MRSKRLTRMTLASLLLSTPIAAQSTGASAPTAPADPANWSQRKPWMRWEYVGDPGNPTSPFGPGRVNQAYLIGKYEVTNLHYAEFLNAKATLGDPLALYNSEMRTDPIGGIARSGSGTGADPYSYSVRLFMADKPVNFVSFYDAMRFSNWMHNGRGGGATETGSYELLGGTAEPQNGELVLRSPGASVVVPTEHEWYKAGHYNPNTGWYSNYATGSGLVPVQAQANATGVVANPGPNVANYLRGADWAGQDGHLTSVGSAGIASESWYACADMNGNISEWNETVFTWSGSRYRKNRGGDYRLDESIMQPGHFGIVRPYYETSTIGFRVARTLP